MDTPILLPSPSSSSSSAAASPQFAPAHSQPPWFLTYSSSNTGSGSNLTAAAALYGLIKSSGTPRPRSSSVHSRISYPSQMQQVFPPSASSPSSLQRGSSSGLTHLQSLPNLHQSQSQYPQFPATLHHYRPHSNSNHSPRNAPPPSFNRTAAVSSPQNVWHPSPSGATLPPLPGSFANTTSRHASPFPYRTRLGAEERGGSALLSARAATPHPRHPTASPSALNLPGGSGLSSPYTRCSTAPSMLMMMPSRAEQRGQTPPPNFVASSIVSMPQTGSMSPNSHRHISRSMTSNSNRSSLLHAASLFSTANRPWHILRQNTATSATAGTAAVSLGFGSFVASSADGTLSTAAVTPKHLLNSSFHNMEKLSSANSQPNHQGISPHPSPSSNNVSPSASGAVVEKNGSLSDAHQQYFVASSNRSCSTETVCSARANRSLVQSSTDEDLASRDSTSTVSEKYSIPPLSSSSYLTGIRGFDALESLAGAPAHVSTFSKREAVCTETRTKKEERGEKNGCEGGENENCQIGDNQRHGKGMQYYYHQQLKQQQATPAVTFLPTIINAHSSSNPSGMTKTTINKITNAPAVSHFPIPNISPLFPLSDTKLNLAGDTQAKSPTHKVASAWETNGAQFPSAGLYSDSFLSSGGNDAGHLSKSDETIPSSLCKTSGASGPFSSSLKTTAPNLRSKFPTTSLTSVAAISSSSDSSSFTAAPKRMKKSSEAHVDLFPLHVFFKVNTDDNVAAASEDYGEDDLIIDEVENPLELFELAAGEERPDFSELGRGTYGLVCNMRFRPTGKLYAMKSIRKKSVVEAAMVGQVEFEIAVQQSLVHPNIVRCYACLEDKEHVHMILEYCSNGDLYGKMRRQENRRFSEEETFMYFAQLVNGLYCLHSKGFIHRDLKLENLLLDKNDSLKIADFGWCGSVLGTLKNFNFCGTLDYLAPEMVKGTGHDWRVDTWGAGILLFEMLVGQPPFQSTRHLELVKRILTTELHIPEFVAPDAADAIRLLLQYEPHHRLPLHMLSHHPWIRRMWRSIPHPQHTSVTFPLESNLPSVPSTQQQPPPPVSTQDATNKTTTSSKNCASSTHAQREAFFPQSMSFTPRGPRNVPTTTSFTSAAKPSLSTPATLTSSFTSTTATSTLPTTTVSTSVASFSLVVGSSCTASAAQTCTASAATMTRNAATKTPRSAPPSQLKTSTEAAQGKSTAAVTAANINNAKSTASNSSSPCASDAGTVGSSNDTSSFPMKTKEEASDFAEGSMEDFTTKNNNVSQLVASASDTVGTSISGISSTSLSAAGIVTTSFNNAKNGSVCETPRRNFQEISLVSSISSRGDHPHLTVTEDRVLDVDLISHGVNTGDVSANVKAVNSSNTTSATNLAEQNHKKTSEISSVFSDLPPTSSPVSSPRRKHSHTERVSLPSAVPSPLVRSTPRCSIIKSSVGSLYTTVSSSTCRKRLPMPLPPRPRRSISSSTSSSPSPTAAGSSWAKSPRVCTATIASSRSSTPQHPQRHSAYPSSPTSLASSPSSPKIAESRPPMQLRSGASCYRSYVSPYQQQLSLRKKKGTKQTSDSSSFTDSSSESKPRQEESEGSTATASTQAASVLGDGLINRRSDASASSDSSVVGTVREKDGQGGQMEREKNGQGSQMEREKNGQGGQVERVMVKKKTRLSSLLLNVQQFSPRKGYTPPRVQNSIHTGISFNQKTRQKIKRSGSLCDYYKTNNMNESSFAPELKANAADAAGEVLLDDSTHIIEQSHSNDDINKREGSNANDGNIDLRGPLNVATTDKVESVVDHYDGRANDIDFSNSSSDLLVFSSLNRDSSNNLLQQHPSELSLSNATPSDSLYKENSATSSNNSPVSSTSKTAISKIINSSPQTTESSVSHLTNKQNSCSTSWKPPTLLVNDKLSNEIGQERPDTLNENGLHGENALHDEIERKNMPKAVAFRKKGKNMPRSGSSSYAVASRRSNRIGGVAGINNFAYVRSNGERMRSASPVEFTGGVNKFPCTFKKGSTIISKGGSNSHLSSKKTNTGKKVNSIEDKDADEDDDELSDSLFGYLEGTDTEEDDQRKLSHMQKIPLPTSRKGKKPINNECPATNDISSAIGSSSQQGCDDGKEKNDFKSYRKIGSPASSAKYPANVHSPKAGAAATPATILVRGQLNKELGGGSPSIALQQQSFIPSMSSSSSRCVSPAPSVSDTHARWPMYHCPAGRMPFAAPAYFKPGDPRTANRAPIYLRSPSPSTSLHPGVPGGDVQIFPASAYAGSVSPSFNPGLRAPSSRGRSYTPTPDSQRAAATPHPHFLGVNPIKRSQTRLLCPAGAGTSTTAHSTAINNTAAAPPPSHSVFLRSLFPAFSVPQTHMNRPHLPSAYPAVSTSHQNNNNVQLHIDQLIPQQQQQPQRCRSISPFITVRYPSASASRQVSQLAAIPQMSSVPHLVRFNTPLKASPVSQTQQHPQHQSLYASNHPSQLPHGSAPRTNSNIACPTNEDIHKSGKGLMLNSSPSNTSSLIPQTNQPPGWTSMSSASPLAQSPPSFMHLRHATPNPILPHGHMHLAMAGGQSLDHRQLQSSKMTRQTPQRQRDPSPYHLPQQLQQQHQTQESIFLSSTTAAQKFQSPLGVMASFFSGRRRPETPSRQLSNSRS